jgi:uncharacterized protein with HEPN domain
MKSEMSDLNRLNHIRDCIKDLNVILKDVDEDDFYENIEKRYAVERILEIIGEATNHISKTTFQKTPLKMDWDKIIGFRNIVVHEYFRVDYTIVYKIAKESVPALNEAVLDLISQLES